MHTIYDELWHAAGWAEIVINQDSELEKKWQVFPPKQAETQEEWDKLVAHFLGLLDKMIEFTSKPENINAEEQPGVTVEDYVDCLIMHNTYHLGKIVAMRQMIGAWTPKEQNKK